VQLLEAAAILSFMGKDPGSLPEDRSEWPTFLSGGRLPKVGDVGAGEGGGESKSMGVEYAYPALGYGRRNSSASAASASSSTSTTKTTSTYALHHSISSSSSSVPNPSGPRMHDYSGGVVGGQAVRVRPGLVGVRMPVPVVAAAVGSGGAHSNKQHDKYGRKDQPAIVTRS